MLSIVTKLSVRNIAHTSYRLKSALAGSQVIPSKTYRLKFETKIPQNYFEDNIPTLTPTTIDGETISLLEHLSLVDCANKQGITTLEDAILFADRILHINTDNVEPMYTVLEDR